MNHLVIAPVLLPLLAGIGLLLLRPLPIRWRRWLSQLAVLLQLGLALRLLEQVAGGAILTYAVGDWPAPFGIVLVADRLSVGMLLITALLALFALLHASRGTDLQGRHFHVLFQLQLFGLNGAFLTGDLFNLFVFFEILLLASYGLLLHGGGQARIRAGLHFVVINLAGSTLFLFAVGTLYGVLGTLNMADLAREMARVPAAEQGLVQAAGLLLFGVFALKAALVPLYLWLPAAYSGTSAPAAALFAIMTKVGVYGILRLDTLIFGQLAGDSAHLLADWLLPLALATLVIGMLGVVASTGLQRQVAYLVVASVGTLLTAAGLGTTAGLAAALYYLPHTTFATGALFLLTDSISGRRGELDDRLVPNGTLSHPRLLGTLFFIAAVLIAGLPPMSGFVAKFLILRAALPHPALAWVMALVLVTSLMAVIALARSGSVLFYRARVIEPPAGERLVAELSPATVLLLLCLGLVIWAGAVHEYSLDTAQQLLDPRVYIDTVLGPGSAP